MHSIGVSLSDSEPIKFYVAPRPTNYRAAGGTFVGWPLTLWVVFHIDMHSFPVT